VSLEAIDRAVRPNQVVLPINGSNVGPGSGTSRCYHSPDGPKSLDSACGLVQEGQSIAREYARGQGFDPCPNCFSVEERR
jgi:hypothetical protein